MPMIVTNTHSKTMPRAEPLTSIVAAELATVTGGLLPWEARPAMASVSTGFGTWERSMKAKGLL